MYRQGGSFLLVVVTFRRFINSPIDKSSSTFSHTSGVFLND